MKNYFTEKKKLLICGVITALVLTIACLLVGGTLQIKVIRVTNDTSSYYEIAHMDKHSNSNDSRNETSFTTVKDDIANDISDIHENRKSGDASDEDYNEKEESDDVRIRIVCDAKCEDLNHVGNHFIKRFYVNGNEARNNCTLKARPGMKLVLDTEITDADSNPDSGYDSREITLEDRDLYEGRTIEFTLSVIENNGSYAGNVSEWKISYSIIPINPLRN